MHMENVAARFVEKQLRRVTSFLAKAEFILLQ